MRICWSIVVVALLQSPTSPRKGGNPEAAKVTNPVAATAASASAGKRVYTRLCGRCHGPEGKGDGTAPSGTVSDLTDAAWDYGGSDGEIFAAIAEGTSADMEAYAERIPAAEIWNLVNYLRTLKR